MSSREDGPEEVPSLVTATVELSIGGGTYRARINVPAGPIPLGPLLPAFRSVAESLVGTAVARVEAAGERVSCAKGCGACCRQLVPIAEVEARALRDLIAEMPEPRRSAIRTRFVEARSRLEATGILSSLARRHELDKAGRKAVGLAYFRQGIACPFLEDEACSIYADRPIACREYLVTSPAANCARPSAQTVGMVKLPAKTWLAVARTGAAPADRTTRWVPLILAPEWADNHPDETPPQPGPDLLRAFFEQLAAKEIPSNSKSLPID
jgi:Fe-S-cluster containining protein